MKDERLLIRIKESGLLKSAIADKVGLSSAHLSMMLQNKANMPEEIRNKINSIIDQALKITV